MVPCYNGDKKDFFLDFLYQKKDRMSLDLNAKNIKDLTAILNKSQFSTNNYRWDASSIIGYGSFSKVYKGSDVTTKEPVAIKVLNNFHNIDKFVYEAAIAAKMDHPNICQLLGINTVRRYIAFEYCENGTLSDVLYSKRLSGDGDRFEKLDMIKKHPIKYGYKTLEFGQQLSFSINICSALVWLHSQRIFHQDIKPTNILVTKDSQCKLCDFGSAVCVFGSFSDINILDGRPLKLGNCGSLLYQAPEILNEESIIEQSEVYALIITLWEIFTQELVWRGYNDRDSYIDDVNDGVRPPLAKCKLYPNFDIDSRINPILERGWKHDPYDRPLFSELLKLLEGLETSDT